MHTQKRFTASANHLRRLDSADIRSLRIFCTVVESGSFSGAARVLNVAPSTVSKHIEVLEHALERPLIQRTTRRFKVTDDGKIFFEQCQIALDALAAAVESSNFKAESAEIAGRLRVTAPPALSHSIIGPRLSEFTRRYPQITMEYFVTAASDDLVSEGIDLAIRIDDQPNAKYPSIDVGQERRVFCASPGFLKDNPTPRTPADLRNLNCLINVYTTHQQSWPLSVGKTRTMVPVTGNFASNSGDMIRNLCLDGIGVGMFSYSTVHEDIASGNLVELLEEFQMPGRSIFVVVPHKKYLSDCANVFIDYLREILSADGKGNRFFKHL